MLQCDSCPAERSLGGVPPPGRITMRNVYRMFFGAFAFASAIAPCLAKQDEPLACSVTAPNVTCVMNELDQPRGLAFGPYGTLFVAEAGIRAAPCRPGPGFNCDGHNGPITRLL